MSRPFVIHVQVPLVNYSDPQQLAAKDDAAHLVAAALNHFLNSDDLVTSDVRTAFFDDGLETSASEFQVKDASGEWYPLDHYV